MIIEDYNASYGFALDLRWNWSRDDREHPLSPGASWIANTTEFRDTTPSAIAPHRRPRDRAPLGAVIKPWSSHSCAILSLFESRLSHSCEIFKTSLPKRSPLHLS
jgi:hypothetical protein